MELGARFQTLFESSMNEFFDKTENPEFSNIPFEILLVVLVSSAALLGWKLRGFLLVLMAFYISVSLIWAVVWFTDSILVFSSRPFTKSN